LTSFASAWGLLLRGEALVEIAEQRWATLFRGSSRIEVEATSRYYGRLLAHAGFEDLFAQPDGVRCDLDQLVVADVLKGVL
jgi:hypothetical protein